MALTGGELLVSGDRFLREGLPWSVDLISERENLQSVVL